MPGSLDYHSQLILAGLNIIPREGVQSRESGIIHLKNQQNQHLAISKSTLLDPERNPCTERHSPLCSKLTCLYIREFKKGESPANTTVLQGI